MNSLVDTPGFRWMPLRRTLSSEATTGAASASMGCSGLLAVYLIVIKGQYDDPYSGTFLLVVIGMVSISLLLVNRNIWRMGRI